jgi:phage shock protein C
MIRLQQWGRLLRQSHSTADQRKDRGVALPERIYRRRNERMITGVASGLADYFDIDPTLVRIVFILAALFNGIGVLIYIAMSFMVPEESQSGATAPVPEGDLESMTETPATEPLGTSSEPPLTSPRERLRHRENRHSWAGIILIALGLLFLAQNLGLLWWWNWRVFWPMVLIGVGAILLSRRFRR